MYRILIYLFLISCVISAQEKYFIYFSDKPVDSSSKLFKSSPYYNLALKDLSEKSIQRRAKVMGEDIIEQTDIPINRSYINTVKELGAEIVWELKWFNAVSCYADYNTILKIKSLEFVDRVEKVKSFRLKREDDSKSDFFEAGKSTGTYSLNYGRSLEQFEVSDVPLVHEYGFAGKNVIIGLLDAGFDYANHPALDHINVLDTKDFVYGDDDVSNDNDAVHGTNVLGILAGYEEGELIGPAYEASFVLAKTENPAINFEKNIEEDNFAAGAQWLEAKGVDIISTSLGYNIFDSGEHSYTYEDMDGKTAITTKALELAFSKGVLTISSAGNEGDNSWKYITSPADGFNTIAVGSVTKSNDVASFSSRGPTADGRLKPEVMAVGVSCYSSTPGRSIYKFVNGTSMSAPIVSGIAGQLLSAYPHLTNRQMRQIIIESGDNTDNPDYDRGYGLVSAARALSYPNVKEENGRFSINKMFIGVSDIEPGSVFIQLIRSIDQIDNAFLNSDDELHYNFEPNSFAIGDTVKFRFGYKDVNGNTHYDTNNKYYNLVYGEKNITLSASDIIIDEPLADSYELYQNYPNPFNPTTTIGYYVPETSQVRIRIFNIIGEHVITLVNEELEEGYYTDLVWNGRDKHGRIVSSGAYIYQLLAGKHMVVKKMMKLK